MIKADLHTHTVLSGHSFSTVIENATEAAKKGIAILGITDHGPAIRGAADEIYFHAVKHVPKSIGKVQILFGVEANIIDIEGRLDISDNVLEKLGIVIAGLHIEAGYRDIGRAENTKAVIAAIKNPLVDIISHPYCCDYNLDIEKIAEAASEHKKLLEINSSYFYKKINDFDKTLDRISRMVKVIKQYKWKVAVNSDAHIALSVGRFDELIRYFSKIGLEEKDIINCNVRAVKKYFNID